MVPNNPDQLSCATTGCISLAVGQKDCTAINLRTNKSSGIHKMILTCSGLGCSKSLSLFIQRINLYPVDTFCSLSNQNLECANFISWIEDIST